MAGKRPSTIPEYIQAAPAAGQPLLQQLYELLKSAAPDAQEAIKWGTPFFVEPRFVIAFSAHKDHASLAPTASVMESFRAELEGRKATKGTIPFPYDQPLPEALIRKIAKACVKEVREREGDSFW